MFYCTSTKKPSDVQWGSTNCTTFNVQCPADHPVMPIQACIRNRLQKPSWEWLFDIQINQQTAYIAMYCRYCGLWSSVVNQPFTISSQTIHGLLWKVLVALRQIHGHSPPWAPGKVSLHIDNVCYFNCVILLPQEWAWPHLLQLNFHGYS